MSSFPDRVKVRDAELLRQIVVRARQLIIKRKHWTQEYLAVNANGNNCDPIDKAATRFCHDGALVRAAHEVTGWTQGHEELADRIIDAEKAQLTGGREPWRINDGKRRSTAIARS